MNIFVQTGMRGISVFPNISKINHQLLKCSVGFSCQPFGLAVELTRPGGLTRKCV
jgi:hypothetical protein